MPGLIKAAVVAVSTTVMPVPEQTPAPVWPTAQAATLTEVVTRWAEQAGRPAPAIDPSVGQYRVGKLNLAANDYCAATSKLVAALAHTRTQPMVADCGTASAPLVIVARPAG